MPHEIVITELAPDSRYYYRMKYRVSGGEWQARDEHSFMTQRAIGSSFVFTVTSDSHHQMNTAHQQAMQNIKNDQPDFNIDLGDTFMPDNTTSQSAVDQDYMDYRAPLYMGAIGHSIPIFLSSGNHENEEGWNFDDSPFSIALASVQARKKYYPTPNPNIDQFYTGNTEPLEAIDEVAYGDKYREDYYAWTWGDALFVVIDPFQYTMNLPYTPTAGESSEPVTGDQWSWTLGRTQYDWFKETIQNSNAKFKFVFSHQVTGGILTAVSGVGPGYVRGGAGAAPYFEWGGKSANGIDEFEAHRPGWGDPIHKIMMENGVSAYFHGHDHQYVYEKLDGVVYQEVPSPSMAGSGFSGIYSEADDFTIKMLPGAGHLRLSVNPSLTTVEYVTSNNSTGAIQYSYTIEPNSLTTNHNLTMEVSPVGAGTTNPGTGVHSYSEGVIVPVSASASPGNFFDHWEGACTGAATCQITMDTDKTVTAVFQAALPGKLGNVNSDDNVNSTDALIILSCDAGLNVSAFCPINGGDVNLDGKVNSTDALIILSYDVGISISYPVGEEGLPPNVTPCEGCEN
ncbi:MAG: metallophosphoesterase [Draconibacterium sp.]|nr:metallophosphoesterase [Draconibacterium sp.]